MTITSDNASQTSGAEIGEPIAYATVQPKREAELAAATKKKISLALFSHAQTMIAGALFEFSFVFTRIGFQLDQNLGSDRDKMDMFFDLADIGLNIALFATVAISGWGIWILISSNHSAYSKEIKEHHHVFWPKGAAGARAWIGLASILVVYIGAVVGLIWLEREGLITRGMNDAGQTGIQLLMGILCLVFAVIRIRQGVEFMLGDDMQ
jgi:hypothetical protein